jgi:hypothetical protein
MPLARLCRMTGVDYAYSADERATRVLSVAMA